MISRLKRPSSSIEGRVVKRSKLTSFLSLFGFGSKNVVEEEEVTQEEKDIQPTSNAIPQIINADISRIQQKRQSNQLKKQVQKRRILKRQVAGRGHYGQLDILQAYYDNLQEENDELEHNLTDFYQGDHKPSMMESSVTESAINTEENSTDNESNEKQLIISSKPTEMVSVQTDNGPDSEFEPGYYDPSGELLRPPFLNIDPVERYQLYQLKEQMKIAEFYRNSMRYTVDSRETSSQISSNDNKFVDSSTQTVDDISSLLKTRIFRSYKKKKVSESRKNKSGYFVGEFFYDDKKIIPSVQNSNKDAGYLGHISKPEFPGSKTDGKFKNKNVRHGIDDIYSGKPLNLSVDASVLEKEEERVIKVKAPLAKELKQSTVGPSAGFTFLKGDDSKKEQSEGNDKPDSVTVDKTTKSSIPASTGFTINVNTPNKQEKKKRALSQDEEVPIRNTSASTPKFTFGQKSTEAAHHTTIETIPEGPAFSFDVPATKKPEAVFNFSSKPAEKDSSSSPVASGSLFGAPKTSTSTSSAPLFGAKSGSEWKSTVPEKTEEPQKTAFSFTSAPKEHTVGSTGTSNLFPGISTSDNSDDKKQAVPLFGSISKTETDTKEEAPKNLSFNFGKKDDTSSASLSGADKPAFSFSSSIKEPTKSAADQASESKPFNFSVPTTGAKNDDEKTETVKPFSFQSKTDAETKGIKFSFGEQKDKPTFSFGTATAASAPSTGFGLGSSSSDKAIDSTKLPAISSTSSGAGFSFGGTTKDVTPSTIFGANTSSPFSLGSAQKEEEPDTKKRPFTFGTGATQTQSQPAAKPFSFNTVLSSNSSREATPVFGGLNPQQSAQSTQGAPSGFSFGQTTAPAFGSSQAGPFGQQPQQNAPQAFGFGNNANTATANSSFGSGSGTPGFGFNRSNTGTPNPTFQPSTAPNFNFGANTNGDPSQIFSQATQQPASIFGGAAPGFSPGTPGTPIITPHGRKLARMRRPR